MSFSTDDGGTWTQSQGSGQPAGVDHQTVGGGPYNEATVPPPIHPLYPNQVYYASQDIGTAFAARSDTGGLTFQSRHTNVDFGAVRRFAWACQSRSGWNCIRA